jgi:hypothetical protein
LCWQNIDDGGGIWWSSRCRISFFRLSSYLTFQDTLTSFLPKHTPNEPLVIPGSREAAVRDYCGWLESRATDEEYKADFRKVCQFYHCSPFINITQEATGCPNPNSLLNEEASIGLLKNQGLPGDVGKSPRS